ncbi:tRNA uridine 5-carboxymethylaminomethyl modification enzyme MnmG [Striga asiatica]|uniref:tRNA uridine 5-carboxymethylaminomethyl modification enzyme MnmG n=1 Tax=Striga asiatica TaxID=4170 RepID=A0A5A7QH80_STRAF|nr:tRNA uridine 5-carboxymethylaminomethyl modification enzyme MnmG [Striga asiatica]
MYFTQQSPWRHHSSRPATESAMSDHRRPLLRPKQPSLSTEKNPRRQKHAGKAARPEAAGIHIYAFIYVMENGEGCYVRKMISTPPYIRPPAWHYNTTVQKNQRTKKSESKLHEFESNNPRQTKNKHKEALSRALNNTGLLRGLGPTFAPHLEYLLVRVRVKRRHKCRARRRSVLWKQPARLVADPTRVAKSLRAHWARSPLWRLCDLTVHALPDRDFLRGPGGSCPDFLLLLLLFGLGWAQAQFDELDCGPGGEGHGPGAFASGLLGPTARIWAERRLGFLDRAGRGAACGALEYGDWARSLEVFVIGPVVCFCKRGPTVFSDG